MSRVVAIELEIPDDLSRFRLPAGVQARLQELLLDRQDGGIALTAAERQQEAEGLVNLAELLSLLRLRGERAGQAPVDRP